MQQKILLLVLWGRSNTGPPFGVYLLLLKTPRPDTGLAALVLSWSQAYFSHGMQAVRFWIKVTVNLLQIASAEKYLSYFKEIFTVNKYREVDLSHWIMKFGRNSLKDFYFFFLIIIICPPSLLLICQGT